MRRLLAALLVALLPLAGCASMNQKCSYYADGILETYRVRSTVLGTGETELVTTDCTALAYSTEDTGLSDNGKAAILGIADTVSENLRPGGQLEGSIADLLSGGDD